MQTLFKAIALQTGYLAVSCVVRPFEVHHSFFSLAGYPHLRQKLNARPADQLVVADGFACTRFVIVFNPVRPGALRS